MFERRISKLNIILISDRFYCNFKRKNDQCFPALFTSVRFVVIMYWIEKGKWFGCVRKQHCYGRLFLFTSAPFVVGLKFFRSLCRDKRKKMEDIEAIATQKMKNLLTLNITLYGSKKELVQTMQLPYNICWSNLENIVSEMADPLLVFVDSFFFYFFNFIISPFRHIFVLLKRKRFQI